MNQKTILFSRASVKFKAPEHTGITEYDRRSAEEYQRCRKEYDPPADDSEKHRPEWHKYRSCPNSPLAGPATQPARQAAADRPPQT